MVECYALIDVRDACHGGARAGVYMRESDFAPVHPHCLQQINCIFAPMPD